MEEKKLTEQESLQLIGRMIYEAKGYFYENGMSALVYGFSVLICSVLAFIEKKESIAFPLNPFYLLVPVFFVQGVIQYRQDKKKKAKTFTDEAVDFVWMGFFIAVLVSLSALWAGVGYLIISFILILIGIACFLTGMITKFRFHVVTGFVAWLSAIFSFFINTEINYLLLAAIAVLIWIIPGFILRSKFKQVQQAEKE
ncbi:MAG: hypothetical protein QM764_17025 [Chitinophagaceae bacterium]